MATTRATNLTTGNPFRKRRYASFDRFIADVSAWLEGPGAQAAQLCGCSVAHPLPDDWASFKVTHFDDNAWNGTYVVHGDTKRAALLHLVHLAQAGSTAETIFTADRTARGTRTIRVEGRANAEGFYVYRVDRIAALEDFPSNCPRR